MKSDFLPPIDNYYKAIDNCYKGIYSSEWCDFEEWFDGI